MAWVTFALSLLHICVGFILPLRALPQFCVANGYGRLRLPTPCSCPSDGVHSSCQEEPDALAERAGFAPALLSPWSQTISSCPEVWTSDAWGVNQWFLWWDSVIPVASPVGEEESAAASGVMRNNCVAVTAHATTTIWWLSVCQL